MVLITEGASTELRRLLSYHAALPRQGVRLRVDELGSLKMAIDAPHLGDAVIRRDKVLLVIMPPPSTGAAKVPNDRDPKFIAWLLLLNKFPSIFGARVPLSPTL